VFLPDWISTVTYVIFATPSLDHKVTVDFLRSALATDAACEKAGFTRGWAQRCGDPFIAKARSKMVAEFLDTPEATDLFFLDDDLGWPAHKVIEFLNRPEDVICGVYPKKQDKPDWPVSLAAHADTRKLVERDGLIMATHVPTGFLRIKRHVLEDLYYKAPVFRDVEINGDRVKYHAVFNSGPGADEWWWGEDYAFSNALTAAGYEMWVDPDIAFKHRGSKTWTGTLIDGVSTFRDRARTIDGTQRVSEAHASPAQPAGKDGKGRGIPFRQKGKLARHAR